jgi:hypothetical protein
MGSLGRPALDTPPPETWTTGPNKSLEPQPQLQSMVEAWVLGDLVLRLTVAGWVAHQDSRVDSARL